MNRRGLLISVAALLPLSAALVACNKPVTTTQIASDVQLIASGLQPVVNALVNAPNVSASVIAQVQGYLATIKADAAQIAASTATPAVGTVQQIVQAVQALAGIAGSIPALAPYAMAIQAAVALLPVLLADVGVVTSGAKPSMTPMQARAILAASH